jgi:hypothetical protein
MRVSRGALGLLVLGVGAAIGCGSSYDYTGSDLSYGYSYSGRTSGSVEQPTLAVSESAVAEALASRTAEAQETDAALRVEHADPQTLTEAVDAVRTCYAKQARGVADEVIAAHPQLYTWDQANDVVEISTTYRKSGWGGQIELSMERKEGVTGPVAVAFPPGTYGVANTGRHAVNAPAAFGDARGHAGSQDEQRYRNWPSAQDLAMLRAPVIYMAAGATSAKASIGVACASFHMGPPQSEQSYTLKTFKSDTPVDRLMQAICAGDSPPSDTDVQLAVWLSRDDISWEEFQKEGGHYGRLVTFGTSSPVLPSNSRGASKLLLDAGVNPRELRFFDPSGSTRPARPADQVIEATPTSVEEAPAAPEPKEPVEQTEAPTVSS